MSGTCHTPYSGKFPLYRALSRNLKSLLQYQKTTPTNSFACKIPVCVTVIFAFSVCPRKTQNFAPHKNFPLCTVYMYCTLALLYT